MGFVCESYIAPGHVMVLSARNLALVAPSTLPGVFPVDAAIGAGALCVLCALLFF